jgi:hypothetical protein
MFVTGQRQEAAMGEQEMSSEQIKAAASESLAAGVDIRERVRDLTLQALRARRLDLGGMREVMQAMTEGVSAGAAQRSAHDLRFALSEAFAGMDQAMSKAAQASSLALKEMGARGREFSDTELRQGLERIRQMEGSLLDAVLQVSRAGTGTLRNEWQDVLTHAQRAGTDTGRVISATARDFSVRLTASLSDGAIAGMEVAREFGERFAALASGLLAGMSEALRPDKDRTAAVPPGDRKP